MERNKIVSNMIDCAGGNPKGNLHKSKISFFFGVVMCLILALSCGVSLARANLGESLSFSPVSTQSAQTLDDVSSQNDNVFGFNELSETQQLSSQENTIETQIDSGLTLQENTIETQDEYSLDSQNNLTQSQDESGLKLQENDTNLVGVAPATKIYINSTSGLDTNDGLSADAPIKTASKALEFAQSYTYTLVVMAPIYIDSNFSPVNTIYLELADGYKNTIFALGTDADNLLSGTGDIIISNVNVNVPMEKIFCGFVVNGTPSSLTIRNCEISIATMYDRGLVRFSSGSENANLTIENTSINSIAYSGYYFDFGKLNNVVMKNVKINENRKNNGIRIFYFEKINSLTINNCDFYGLYHEVQDCSVFHIAEVISGGSVSITNTKFEGKGSTYGLVKVVAGTYDLTIDNVEANNITIPASTDASVIRNVFYFGGTIGTANINRLSVDNCSMNMKSTTSSIIRFGTISTAINFTNCEFTNNTLKGFGRVVLFYNSVNNVTIDNCKFINSNIELSFYFNTITGGLNASNILFEDFNATHGFYLNGSITGDVNFSSFTFISKSIEMVIQSILVLTQNVSGNLNIEDINFIKGSTYYTSFNHFLILSGINNVTISNVYSEDVSFGRVFYFSTISGNATISSCNIKGSNIFLENCFLFASTVGGSVRFEDCRFENITKANTGSFIQFNNTVSGDVSFLNTNFYNVKISKNEGVNPGVIVFKNKCKSVNVDNCIFDNCTGAFLIAVNSSLRFDKCYFNKVKIINCNVYSFIMSAYGNIYLLNCYFDNNISSQYLIHFGGSTLQINNTTIQNSETKYHCLDIWVDKININNLNIYNFFCASYYIALYCAGINSVKISNCSFINCAKNGSSIQIYRYYPDGDVIMENIYIVNSGACAIRDGERGSGFNIKLINYTAIDSEIYFNKCIKNLEMIGCKFINSTTSINLYRQIKVRIVDCVFERCIKNNLKSNTGNLKNDIASDRNNSGGAIRLYGVDSESQLDLEIDNCSFIDCTAFLGGALSILGLYNKTYSAKIRNCIFENNLAGSGGAMYIEANYVNLDVENCWFHDNSARYSDGSEEYGGGAIVVKTKGKNSRINIDGGIFERNKLISTSGVQYGGAIYYKSMDEVCENEVIVQNAKIVNNGGTRAIGGAVYGATKLINVEIVGNNAKYCGAIYSDGECEIKDSKISGNGAVLYGVGYIWKADIKNSEFSKNVASTSWAGLTSSYAYLYDSEFSNNEAKAGSVVFAQYQLLIDGCQFLSNSTGSEGIVYLLADRFDMENEMEISDTTFSTNICGQDVVKSEYYCKGIRLNNVKFMANEIGKSVICISANPLDSSRVVDLENCVFASNNLVGEYTRGIFDIESTEEYPGIINAKNLSVYGNMCASGAILQIDKTTKYNTIKSEFYNNVGGKGGAIYVGEGVTFDTTGITFGYNKADKGNAIYLETGSKVNIDNIKVQDAMTTTAMFYLATGSVLNVVGGNISNVGTTGIGMGGIFEVEGQLYIKNLELIGNKALAGGVAYVHSNGTMTIENCNMVGNTATYGGVIAVGKITEDLGENGGVVTLKSGNMTGNSATYGGAVYVGENGNFVSSCTIKGVISSTGAQLVSTQLLEPTAVSITKVYEFGKINNNQATQGGAIYICTGGVATLNGDYGYNYYSKTKEISANKGTELVGNTATTLGGGCYVASDGILIVNGAKFEDNIISTDASAPQGGSIYCIDGTVKINKGYLLNTKTYTTQGAMIYGVSSATGRVNISVESAVLTAGISSKPQGETRDSINVTGNGVLKINECEFYYAPGIFVNDSITENGDELEFDFVMKRATFNSSNTELWMNILYADNATLEENEFNGFVLWDVYLQYCTNVKFYDNNFTNCKHYFGIKNTTSVDMINNTMDGGDIRFGIKNNKRVYFYGLEIKNTKSGGWDNGPLYFGNCKNIVIDSSNFYDNIATYSGQKLIDYYNDTTSAKFEFKDCNIINNKGYQFVIRINQPYYNSAETILSGNINIVDNVTTSRNIYYDIYLNLLIKRNSLVIIDRNTLTDGTSNNLSFGNNAPASCLEGDLHPDSRIGLTNVSGLSSGTYADGTTAIAGINKYTVLSSSMKDIFYSDIDGYDLEFVADGNGQRFVYKKVKNVDGFVVVADAISVPFDASKKVEYNLDDVKLYFGESLFTGDYKIYFVDDDGNKIEKQEFRNVGNYTVKFKVEYFDTETNEYVALEPIYSTKVNIYGKRIYLDEAPTVYKFEEYWFVGGKVIDEYGSAVLGTWNATEVSGQPDKATITFTPANASIFDANSINAIQKTVDVYIYYDRVFFYGTGFYTTYTGSSGSLSFDNRITGISNLKDMVAHMNNNGQIIFASTYKVTNNLLITTEKNITFIRHYAFDIYTETANDIAPMFDVMGTNAKLEMYSTNGSINFDGLNSWTELNTFSTSNYEYTRVKRSPLIYVRANNRLVLGRNVMIKNYYLQPREAGKYTNYSADFVGLVVNYGKAVFDGCYIFNNTFYVRNNDSIGGVVKNFGQLDIVDGYFYNNTNLAYDYSNTASGCGGFLYSTGTVTMTGGSITNNKSLYGGAICLGNQVDNDGISTATVGISTFKFLGGRIYNNNTTGSNGGAIYFYDGDVQLVLGEGFFKYNSNGAIGRRDASTATDWQVVDVKLNSVSQDVLLKLATDNQAVFYTSKPSTDQMILVLLVAVFALAFICVVSYKHKKTMQKFRIKNK